MWNTFLNAFTSVPPGLNTVQLLQQTKGFHPDITDYKIGSAITGNTTTIK